MIKLGKFQLFVPQSIKILYIISHSTDSSGPIVKHEIKLENSVYHEKYKNNKILSDKSPKSSSFLDENVQERRRKLEEMRIASENQKKYENQLKKMGIPVINGLVNENQYIPNNLQSHQSIIFVCVFCHFNFLRHLGTNKPSSTA